MKSRLNQKGFASWELLLGVLIIAVIVFAGYHVYKSHTASTVATSNSSHTTTNSGSTSVIVPNAPAVSSTSDLDKASAALNQTDPNSSNAPDSSQLSSQANF